MTKLNNKRETKTMKNETLNSISVTLKSDILQMNQEQLNLVAQAVQDRRRMISLKIKSKYIVGDTVQFTTKGKTIMGEITKIMVKNIQVLPQEQEIMEFIQELWLQDVIIIKKNGKIIAFVN